MALTLSDICGWAETNASKRNFREGERILEAGHISSCSKKVLLNNSLGITAYCLATSKLSGPGHKIEGVIQNDGTVLSMQCSCKAGRGEKCKHILGVLLNCYKSGVENLKETSCTDTPCSWKKDFTKSLRQYVPTPLRDLPTFKLIQNKTPDTLQFQNEFTQSILANLPNSALAKSMKTRHAPKIFVAPEVELQFLLSDEIQQLIRNIFTHQATCNLHKWLKNLVSPPLKPCCQRLIDSFGTSDPAVLCEKTRSYPVWLEARKFRITGSRIYEIYTYSSNKSPDWKNKCSKYFNPKQFQSEYTEHGISQEATARSTFSHVTKKNVIETGLIISQENPWLGYSPDGVIFNHGVPCELLEIKCPFKGKTMTILDVVKSGGAPYLELKDGNYSLKKKHQYYGQVQLGMFMLNVSRTNFVVYASFDSSIFIVDVLFDQSFTLNMLKVIDKSYFGIMLHYICSDCSTNQQFH